MIWMFFAAAGAAIGAGIVLLNRSESGKTPPMLAPGVYIKEVLKKGRSGPRDVYVTKQSDVVIPEWVEVGGELQTVTPLLDRSTGGFAQLSYAGALDVARAAGADLISRSGVDARSRAARAAGTELVPVTLPDDAMIRAAGIYKLDQKAIGALLNSMMRSSSWAKIHDDRVLAVLRSAGWNGRTVTSNVGKPWVSGAASGRGRLYGWFKKDGSAIQQEGDHHDDKWVDYATKTILKKKKK